MSGIRTGFTELVEIDHPIVSAGMGGGAAGGELAGAVSEADGLGIVGASWLSPEAMRGEVERARERIEADRRQPAPLRERPPDRAGARELEPAVFSTAWPRDDQKLRAIFAQAHDRSAKVMHMVTTLPDAARRGRRRDRRTGHRGRRSRGRDRDDRPVGRARGLGRPAGEIVRRILAEAEAILRERVPALLR